MIDHSAPPAPQAPIEPVRSSFTVAHGDDRVRDTALAIGREWDGGSETFRPCAMRAGAGFEFGGFTLFHRRFVQDIL